MRKEEKKQEKYYALKDQYAREFSELMIQRLGLVYDENGFLMYEDIYVGGGNLRFYYKGYNYVAFENSIVAEEKPETVKVFDPYNDLGLATFCVMQFLCYIKEIDVNECVSIIAVSNSKMNSVGACQLTFTKAMGNKKITGHEYHRDCLKFLDMIYILDDADDIEYNVLHNLDLINYDEFEI